MWFRGGGSELREGMAMKKLFIILALLGIFSSIGFAATISDCQAITVPDTYTLTADLSGVPPGEVCFRIDASASGATLDCQGHIITNGGSIAILLNGANNTVVKNCQISNYQYGIYLNKSNYDNITNVILSSTTYGFYLDSSSYNTFTKNIAHDNYNNGFYVAGGASNNLTDNLGYDNYNGDLYVNGNGMSGSISVSNLTLTNPTGSLENYTSLSLSDTIGPYEKYWAKWSWTNSQTQNYLISFRQKSVMLGSDTPDPVSIDTVKWTWQPSELAGYNESGFELWTYNSRVSNTVIDHSFTVSNIVPERWGTFYGIYQLVPCVNMSLMGDDYLVNESIIFCQSPGYQINDSGAPGVVIINADNIAITCPNPSYFTGNGSGIGFAISNHKNVTIENCHISNYDTAVKLTNTNGSQFLNNQIQGKTYGYYLDSSHGNNFTGYNIHSQGDRYAYYLVSSSRNSFFDGAYGDTGLYLLNSPNNYISAQRGLYTNNYGVQLINSDNNKIGWTDGYYQYNVVVYSPVGVLINNSDNTSIEHYESRYITSPDAAIIITTNTGSKTVHGRDVFSILDFDDEVADDTAYLIKATSETPSAPSGYNLFGNSTVNISTITGPVSIDSITFKYGDPYGDGLAGYNESTFGLWKYSSGAWSQVPAVQNTTAHTLTATGLNPQSLLTVLYSGYPVFHLGAGSCPIVLTQPGTYFPSEHSFGGANGKRSTSDPYCLKIQGSNITVISDYRWMYEEDPIIEINGSDNTITGMYIRSGGDPEVFCRQQINYSAPGQPYFKSCEEYCAGQQWCLDLYSVPADHYPAIAIVGGTNNRIIDNDFWQWGSSWYDEYSDPPYGESYGPPSATILVKADGNEIRGNVFEAFKGPAIYFKGGASNNYIDENDFMYNGVVDTGTNNYEKNSIGNWWEPYINTSDIYWSRKLDLPGIDWSNLTAWRMDSNYNFELYDGLPYQIPGTKSSSPFIIDVDNDDFGGPLCAEKPWNSSYKCYYKQPYDNCPTMPNADQQDLDGNGKGTACDSNEFDINVRSAGNYNVYAGTGDFYWAAPGGFICGFNMFAPGSMEFNSTVVQPTLNNLYSPAMITFPMPFALGGQLTSCGTFNFHGGWSDYPPWGDAGTYHNATVNYTTLNGKHCEGGSVAGPVSLTGVGYAMGFNPNCTEDFVKRAVDNDEEQTVQYLIGGPTGEWEMYRYYELGDDSCGARNVSGLTFTLDPNDQSDPTCALASLMGIVFKNKRTNNTVRFSVPIVTTSGNNATLSTVQEANFISTCISMANKSNNDMQGVINACNNATYLPRGVNITAGLGKLRAQCFEEAPPSSGYEGFGGCIIESVVPPEFFQSIPDNNTHLAISNMQSLADKDAIHIAATMDLNPKFTFTGSKIVGSYIPCIGTYCLFNNSNLKFAVVPGDLDLTNKTIVRNGLGLAVFGGVTQIQNSVFDKHPDGDPYMGIAVGPGSGLFIYDSTLNGSVSGIVGANSRLYINNMSMYTPTVASITGINTKEFRDIRSKIVWTCANESNWVYSNKTKNKPCSTNSECVSQYGENASCIDGLCKVLEKQVLPNGMDTYKNTYMGLLGTLTDAYWEYVGCGVTIENSTLDAGDLNAMAFLIDEVYPGKDIRYNAPIPAKVSIKNVNIPDSRTGIGFVGTKQTEGNPVQLEITNTDIHANAGIGVGGNTNFVIDNVNFVGGDDSFWGVGVVESGSPWIAQMMESLEHYPYELQNLQVAGGVISNLEATNVGASPYADEYPGLAAAVVINNANSSDPLYNDATIALSNIVSESPVSLYGDPVITTSGEMPPVIYPEKKGIMAIVTSNDVVANGKPGQQPLNGAKVSAFNKADTCVKQNFPDAQAVATNCASKVSASCVTLSNGQCLIGGLVPADYFVVVESTRWPGKYPSHVVGALKADETRQARFAFLKDPTGKVNPAKTTFVKGSELWIYEPDYVVWNGTEEYYPFVFETPDQTWTVNVCLAAPAGYQPVDGVTCVQTLIAGESKAILFKLVEVGSVPGKTKVNMDLTTPKGKKLKHSSEVDIRLTDNLAKAKGVAIDKNGRLLGKGKLEGDMSIVILLSVLGIALLGGLMYFRGRGNAEPEDKPAKAKPEKKSKRK